MNRISLTVLLGFLAVTSCKKNKDALSERVDFKFENTTDRKMTVDIYLSETDYGSNQNRYGSKSAEPGATISFSGLKAGADYFVDWYSEDHKYNNWANASNINIQPVTYKITPGTDSNKQVIRTTGKGISKILFLKGDETKTEWIAVDAICYDSTSTASCWKRMPEYKKHHKFVVNKNFTLTEFFKDDQGIVHEFSCPIAIYSGFDTELVEVSFERNSSHDILLYAPIFSDWHKVAPFSLDTIHYETIDARYRIARQ